MISDSTFPLTAWVKLMMLWLEPKGNGSTISFFMGFAGHRERTDMRLCVVIVIAGNL